MFKLATSFDQGMAEDWRFVEQNMSKMVACITLLQEEMKSLH
jgi:hypothetical protein